MIRKLRLVLLLCICSFLAAGCKPIFQTKIDKYKQIKLDKTELENEMFYIKDGTKFVKVYKADTKSVHSLSGNTQGVCMLTKDYQTVPTLYKNEIIALPSQNIDVSEISLTRYKELGWSMGLYGLSVDEDGAFTGTLGENIYKNSELYELFDSEETKNFKITAINGNSLTLDMLSDSGAFTCFDEKATYDVSYYAGTHFSEKKMTADTFLLEEYEYYTLQDISDSQNGYMSYCMPEDAKSGWYYINGAGLFRYIADDKGADLATINMNEPYYESLADQQAAFSQKFSTNFETRLKNVTISFDVDPLDAMENTISGTVFSPDDTAYEMVFDQEKCKLYCALDEAMAGKWYIYIQPKDAVIKNMEILSNEMSQEITEEDYNIAIYEGQIHYRIVVSYKGDGEIYAILVDNDNETHKFEQNEKERKLYYDASYLSPGEYTVKVYHYTDTAIESVDTQENTVTDSDIITVTQ